MESQKTTLIKPKRIKEKENQNLKILGPIIMLIIGIILLTNSSKAVIIVCYSIGAVIIAFGAFQLLSYYRLKQELNVEDNKKMVVGTSTIFIGIIVILLSGAIETFLRFIIGFALVFNGVKKTMIAINERNSILLIEGIIFVAMGLYTILAENIVFQIIGVLLILSSIIDLVTYFKEKNKA